jgi:hypothetical protein
MSRVNAIKALVATVVAYLAAKGVISTEEVPFLNELIAALATLYAAFRVTTGDQADV